MTHRILLVDDEAQMCWILTKVLEGAGFSVRSTGSPKEALHWIETEPVDLVVSDYAMPEMNGVEFLREARRQGRLVPFVFITAYPETTKKLLEGPLAPGTALMAKPFRNGELVATIKEMLSLASVGA